MCRYHLTKTPIHLLNFQNLKYRELKYVKCYLQQSWTNLEDNFHYYPRSCKEMIRTGTPTREFVSLFDCVHFKYTSRCEHYGSNVTVADIWRNPGKDVSHAMRQTHPWNDRRDRWHNRTSLFFVGSSWPLYSFTCDFPFPFSSPLPYPPSPPAVLQSHPRKLFHSNYHFRPYLFRPLTRRPWPCGIQVKPFVCRDWWSIRREWILNRSFQLFTHLV